MLRYEKLTDVNDSFFILNDEAAVTALQPALTGSEGLWLHGQLTHVVTSHVMMFTKRPSYLQATGSLTSVPSTCTRAYLVIVILTPSRDL